MTAALATPTLLIIISAIIFLVLERVRPGRELPNAPGWYFRVLLVNGGQIAIERHLGAMLLFRDVYNYGRKTPSAPQSEKKAA